MMKDMSGAAPGVVGPALATEVFRLDPTALLNVGVFALLDTRSYSSRLSAEKAGMPCCDDGLSFSDVLPVDSVILSAIS
jgi:hypothetical protein